MSTSEKPLRLFIVFLGGKPPGTGITIEQHNVVFGIGREIEDLYPLMRASWPEAKHTLHMDGYAWVYHIQNYEITVRPKAGEVGRDALPRMKLFFFYLGGYAKGQLGEDHKIILIIDETMGEAAKRTEGDEFFGLHPPIDGAGPHIDNKKLLDHFDEDGALDVSGIIESQGYVLEFSHSEFGYHAHPRVFITGFHKVPMPAA